MFQRIAAAMKRASINEDALPLEMWYPEDFREFLIEKEMRENGLLEEVDDEVDDMVLIDDDGEWEIEEGRCTGWTTI